MKRISLLVGCMVLSLSVLAQNSAINKADRYRKAGDLAQAKENIDAAVVHEKTMDEGKAWFTYGQVYEDIFNAEDPTLKALDENALDKAMAGYRKAMELEEETSSYYQFASVNLENLWGGLLNKGAQAYQAGDNAVAFEWFNLAKEVKPADTTAYLYAGIVAQGMENPEAVLENFRELVNLGYQDIGVYNSIIYYTRTHEQDTTAALEWIGKAREQFPDDGDLRKQEVNLLIQTGQTESAKNGLEEAIANEPDNANLLFNLGYLYEELGNKEKAIENYKKAIEADPNYFDAVYNLAVYYYNAAADLYSEANNLTIREYDKRGKKLEEEARENLRQSMPYMEKASEIRPEEPTIWQTLSTIYTRLEMSAKAEEAYNKYDALLGN